MFMLAMLLCFIIVSVANETLYVKSVRDMLLIAVFFTMGGFITEKSLILSFRILSIVVLAVMVIENFATDLYAAIFKPSVYYLNTRGIEEFEIDDSGLFRASLGYAERFSFGLTPHRLSSVFLEQVSLGNFAMILSIFLLSFWKKLKNLDRTLLFTTVLLIVLATSSRAASIICLAFLIGYFVYPRLPRMTVFLYMPLILLVGAILFYDPKLTTATMSDDLPGRVGNTMYFLSQMDISFLTGGGLADIASTGDSGYGYLIFTTGLLGLLCLWLFTCLSIPQKLADAKQASHAINIYVFVNLLFGASIFSIKTNPLVWIIAGYFYYRQFKKS